MDLPNGARLPIRHWENNIGRAPSSDIVLNYPTVSRSHAVLIRSDDGSWSITGIGSKGGLIINGRPVEGQCPIYSGDIISLAGMELALLSTDVEQEQEWEEMTGRKEPRMKPGLCSFMWLYFFVYVRAAVHGL
ncbi:MAG: FHA domain-containing protein [Oscillospiraceae bacterium]|nr:FHA domain-containing protein [Oscillospiraceae bacterium]